MPTGYSQPVDHQQAVSKNPWSPGVGARFPWLGFSAILGTVAGIAGSASIIIFSNGKPITNWTFQPATYLSIASTLTNICLAFALSEAATVSWWSTALKSNTTVLDLHRRWTVGGSFVAALLSLNHISLLAVACMIATIAQINGPLFQHASTATVETVTSNVNINMRIAPELPPGYTGMLSGRAYTVPLYSSQFTQVVLDYNNHAAIAMNNSGCSGTCSTTVFGAGLAVNCSAALRPFQLLPSKYFPNGTWDLEGDMGIVVGIDIFETYFTWSPGAADIVNLNILYKNTNSCTGNLQIRTCTLRSALVQFPVVIDGNQSTIVLDPSTTIWDDAVVRLNPVDSIESHAQIASTLAGFWKALDGKYNSTAHSRFTGAVGYTLDTTGDTLMQYATLDIGNASNITQASLSAQAMQASTCSVYFQDPLPDLLAAARELMFRTSLSAANSTTPDQLLPARQVADRAIYRSNFIFMGAAIGVTMLGAILVLANFWGYHKLGRNFSMSPVEIAKAFDAPLLKNRDSNAMAKILLEEFRHKSIRYGVVVAGGGEELRSMIRDHNDYNPNQHRHHPSYENSMYSGDYAYAHTSESSLWNPDMAYANTPKTFSEAVHEQIFDHVRRRLVMATDDHSMQEPRKGMIFEG